MTTQQTETDILRELVPELVADGYEVYLNPNRPIAPAFLGDFSPDAVALRSDKNLVIEVVRQSPHAEEKIKRVSALIKDQPKWELRVVWVSPTSRPEGPRLQSRGVIAKRIEEARDLSSNGHFAPAFLMAWATFEAIARALKPMQFGRPQTPGRIVELLASGGELAPTEADRLRELALKRNSFIHGDLSVRVSKGELDWFLQVLEELSKAIRPKGVTA